MILSPGLSKRVGWRMEGNAGKRYIKSGAPPSPTKVCGQGSIGDYHSYGDETGELLGLA